MRIKKIEVVGFKSFAEREVVVLDDHVTGVIGPNGCGKSNIVDAMRWCLGEQRAKHLRGSGMADVIFAGTSTRGPAGMAEVTIVFENSGDSPAAFMRFSEIAVTRRLFRDGASEYLINKVPCRLRDINDMLMGSGVSAKSGYSIIEQGRVSQIVTSKPESRRQVIDEAAGITKFKQQKHQAERKIEQTRQNLLRVTDVIGELEGRLGTLKRQAQKAERYKRYRSELRDLELWNASHKLLELRATARVLEQRRAALDERVEDLRHDSAAIETRLEADRVALREVETELSRQQEALYELENRIQLIEQDRRYKLQEQEGLRRSADQSRAERDAVTRGSDSLERELAEVKEQQATLGEGDGGEGLEAQASRLGAELDEITASLRSERELLEQRRRELARTQQRSATLEATILSRTESVAELRERAEVMAAEASALEQSTDSDSSRLEAAQAELTQIVERLEGVRERRSSLDRERVELRERLRPAEVEVETARKELMRARSRLQSLEEIQSRYQACQSGVQVVMEHREALAEYGAQLSASAGLHGAELGAGAAGPTLSPGVRGIHGIHGIHGIMADFITAPAHLESAVSAVLGDRLQGVVVDAPVTGASGVELLKHLKEGRTTFLPVSSGWSREQVSGEDATPRDGRPLGWSAPERGSAGRIEVVDLVSDLVTDPVANPAGAAAPVEQRTIEDQLEQGISTPDADSVAIEHAAAQIDLDTTADDSSESTLAAGEPQTSLGDAAPVSPLIEPAPAPAPAAFEVAAKPAGPKPDALGALRGVEGVVGRLSELVEVEPQLHDLVEVLLGETVVVDRLARALELWHRLRRELPAAGRVPHTLVTLDGDRIEPSGVVVGGSRDAIDSALLQQKREIGELQAIVTELEVTLTDAQQRRQALAERLDEVERGREVGEAELLEAEKARVLAVREVSAIEEAGVRLHRQVEQLQRGRAELELTLEQRQAERLDLEEELAELRERSPELEDEAAEVEQRVEVFADAREQVSTSLTEIKVALASWQEQRNALASAALRLGKQITSERDRARRLGEAADEADARIATLGEAVEAMAVEHATLLDQHKLTTAAKHDAAEAHDAAVLRVDELELSIRDRRRQLEDQREQLQEVELGLRELVLERQHLEADIRDRFDVELRTMLVDFHDRALATASERERIRELKRILSRMGEVNLTAIGEYEEVSGRYEYLSSQRKDLEDAVNQLQEAIDRINATTKERFAETFAAVNEMFQRLFPRLFNGGQAKLVLTDPTDMLTTGVDILAQPPGKKVANLELLSGGEKALTAVSLIFGIFLIKSSPFCLLDEVDAPLDEANVGRFCDLVRELAQGTQFIIITHNKRTMEIADRLYGVTMQQRGVSKLVSVNMRRAIAEAMVS
ncbi:chromosome segregation protein SMC [Enhygromyxa salina]|uniref:Chromosome partition protein Smc n=1 Tax=Enhygromyxa salina TaxID=215803 RepID=A0A2S9YW42_9BACT|nr:chromosome segregation protein SMC [Enhygromyxa salina]PRQ09272.1 Chromosome partition protein Smc [Enhygromyxa salina]